MEIDNRTKLALVALLSGITAACGQNELVLWVANKDVVLYRSPGDDELEEIGRVQAGEVCVPGEARQEKVLQYYELLCEGGQYGWTADSQYFRKILRSVE